MKLIEVIGIVTISIICTLLYLIVSLYLVTDAGEDGVILINSNEFTQNLSQEDVEAREITLALVICGNSSERLGQAITMLKSVILSGQQMKLRVIAFVDNDARPLFTKKTKYLGLEGDVLENLIRIEIKSTWFPKDAFSEWNHLYSLCSTQRLFFPSLLPTTDALIYLDTDILVFNDLKNLWNQFTFMNKSQFLGLAAEHELPGNGWYNTEAKFPYYGPRGLNAGVMLMNLTRMREVHFEHRASDIFKEYRENLKWGDQDILNIYLHFHPEHLLLLPCEWNYRMNHCDCEYGGGDCKCKAAEDKGASLFHGNKGIFLNNKYTFTNKFYQSYNKYDLLHGSSKDLIDELVKSFTPNSDTICKRLKNILTRKIRDQFEDNYFEPFLDFSSGS